MIYRFQHILLLLSASMLNMGCDTHEPSPLFDFALRNPTAEHGAQSPTAWRTMSGLGLRLTQGFDGENAYLFSWSSEIAYTGNRSLSIHADSLLGNVSYHSQEAHRAFWWQTVTVPPSLSAEIVGKTLTLEGYVKTEGVIGRGAMLEIVTYNYNVPTDYNGKERAEGSTARTHNIAFGPTLRGTHNWQFVSISLHPAPMNIASIEVRLGFMDVEFGTVYFDDLTLTVE